MSETLATDTTAEGSEASASAPEREWALETEPMLRRMVAAFAATFCTLLGRIPPAETSFRMFAAPAAPREKVGTLAVHEPTDTSDGRRTFTLHLSKARTGKQYARVERINRAALAKAALWAVFGSHRDAKLACEAHGKCDILGRTSPHWAAALDTAEGPIAAAYAAMVEAQGTDRFPGAQRKAKSGTARRCHAFYSLPDPKGTTKEHFFRVPAALVPSLLTDSSGNEAPDGTPLVLSAEGFGDIKLEIRWVNVAK